MDELLDGLDRSTDSDPLGVVVVAPPWNFPFAIPAGGVLRRACRRQHGHPQTKPRGPRHRGGTRQPAPLRRLRAGCVSACRPRRRRCRRDGSSPHPDVAVSSSPGHGTPRQTSQAGLRPADPRRDQRQERLVISGNADVDAGRTRSRPLCLSHAGQKCSAASLAIVDSIDLRPEPVPSSAVRRDQEPASRPATDPATEVGPIVGPITPALIRALTTLDPHEQWLVEPRQLDERLWTPGVRIGVQPGSWAHRTEWFGPVLGVMRVSGLDEAIHCQNAVDTD